MKKRGACLDMFLAVAAITATLFTIYCSDTSSTAELLVCPDENSVILSPSEGQVFDTGQSVTFEVDTTQPGLETLSYIRWSSNLDGLLGTTDNFSRDDLGQGTHQLTLTLQDDEVYAGGTDRCIYSRTISIAPEYNECPTFDILGTSNNCDTAYCLLSPLDGQTFEEGATISFEVKLSNHASVDQTGIQWYSNIDGPDPLSTLPSFSSTLSAGAHTISVTVHYDGPAYGTGLCTKEVSITVGDQPACPANCGAITFAQPADSSEFNLGEEVQFALAGSLNCVESVVFSSNVDGVLGTGAATSLNISSLSDTTHTITAEVKSTGITTCTYEKTVTVLPCPSTCADITFDKPEVTLLDPGEPVIFELGGNLSCAGDVIYSSQVQGVLDTGYQLFSTTVCGLASTTHTITASVASNGLGTCDLTKEVTVSGPLASYNLPDTGATLCYGNTIPAIPCPAPGASFFGQDAQFGPNMTSIVASSDGTAWDSDTGLIWQRGFSGTFNTVYTWYEAAGIYHATHNPDSTDICGDLALAGLCWRLPTIRELGTITDYGRQYPALDTSVFDYDMGMGGFTLFWSITEAAWSGTRAWTTNVDSGNTSTWLKDLSDLGYGGAYVRCVSGPTLQGADLADNADSTVSDSVTGLMWENTAPIVLGGAERNWEDSLAYCENLAAGGYTDWRMPNIRELESLVDHSTYDPAIGPSPLVDDGLLLSKTYWSSTSWRPLTTEAWVVHFDEGDIGASTKPSVSFPRNVRCVRGP